MLLIALIISVFIVTVIVISQRLGRARGKAKIHHEERQIKLNNPYQYYKELPNNFGIGVTTLLIDSEIEEEKDIVAAILDLCAQKYLRLSKHSDHYVIRFSSNPPKTPLQNEAYLLDLIKNRQLQHINYRAWYDYCVADGVELGLFYPPKSSFQQTVSSKKRPTKRSMSACPIIIMAISAALIPVSPLAVIGVFLPLPIYYFYTVFSSLKRASKDAFQDSYKRTIEQHLKRTPKGIEEAQKLHAFRAFLDQFHTFVDQDPEAVIIWSRYLSYAQVFGIAPKIMSSGYSELINNADFRIDNIDNITLQNILTQVS